MYFTTKPIIKDFTEHFFKVFLSNIENPENNNKNKTVKKCEIMSTAKILHYPI